MAMYRTPKLVKTVESIPSWRILDKLRDFGRPVHRHELFEQVQEHFQSFERFKHCLRQLQQQKRVVMKRYVRPGFEEMERQFVETQKAARRAAANRRSKFGTKHSKMHSKKYKRVREKHKKVPADFMVYFSPRHQPKEYWQHNPWTPIPGISHRGGAKGLLDALEGEQGKQVVAAAAGAVAGEAASRVASGVVDTAADDQVSADDEYQYDEEYDDLDEEYEEYYSDSA
eukprot:TRINITY_DN24413_c0_g1_i1.p1 TRINITY_DN24413_c0_g1~~TRINITY_DN24413_c0_g1_i1.p1  ORF type:complete len:228 (+),score=38.54 TRINITY_DN24413_c0_g1_i1:157-840(+)